MNTFGLLARSRRYAIANILLPVNHEWAFDSRESMPLGHQNMQTAEMAVATVSSRFSFDYSRSVF